MEQSDIIKELSFSKPKEIDGPMELAFDDEPLEQVLYGKVRKDPTPANLYLPAIEYVQRIVQTYHEGKIQDVLEQASELSSKRYLLSTKMCCQLLIVMKGLVPCYPNPVLKFDISVLGLLLEEVWNHFLKIENKSLQEMIGDPLYRWYEHHRKYENARQVLTRLIENGKEKGDRTTEAVMINNLAFEYLLEGLWHEAAPLFETSADIFKENGNEFEYANARANYWSARFEYAGFEEIEKAEHELKTIADKLNRHSDWRTRKPLILLAKIEEKRNNLTEAIQLVQKAIEKSRGSNTRYPEMDQQFLTYLKSKVGY